MIEIQMLEWNLEKKEKETLATENQKAPVLKVTENSQSSDNS